MGSMTVLQRSCEGYYTFVLRFKGAGCRPTPIGGSWDFVSKVDYQQL